MRLSLLRPVKAQPSTLTQALALPTAEDRRPADRRPKYRQKFLALGGKGRSILAILGERALVSVDHSRNLWNDPLIDRLDQA